MPSYQDSPVTPEHDLLALQVRAAQLQRRMVLADALPQVAVGANYSYGKFLADILRDDFGSKTGNGLLFLSVKVPLTEWWETGHKLKEHALAVEQTQLEQQHLLRMLDLRAEQAWEAVQQALLLWEEQQQILGKTRENYRLSQANYTAGMATLTDVLTAQTALLKAQNDLTDAVIAYRVAARRYADFTRCARSERIDSSALQERAKHVEAESSEHALASVCRSETHVLSLAKYDIPFPFHTFW